MREIKFRAWDKKEEKFITIEYGLNISLGGQTTYPYNDSEESADVVLMQYTGLKDKNGVEIYEGDILQYENSAGKKGRTYAPVTFERGKFVVGENNPKSYDMSPHYLGSPSFGKNHIIIGNVHENPDLIK